MKISCTFRSLASPIPLEFSGRKVAETQGILVRLNPTYPCRSWKRDTVGRALISSQSIGQTPRDAAIFRATFLSINGHKPRPEMVVLFGPFFLKSISVTVFSGSFLVSSPLGLSLRPEFQHICTHNPLRLFKLYTLFRCPPSPAKGQPKQDKFCRTKKKESK